MKATTFRHANDNEVMTLCNACGGKQAIRINVFGGYTLQKNEIVSLIALLAEYLRDK